MKWVCAAAVTLSLGAVTQAARAEPVVRPGAAGLLVVNGSDVAGGGVGSLSLGYNLEHEPILIVPHVSGGFGYYAGDASGIFGRALAGMRFGAALAVEPSLITRGGYGHYRLGPPGSEVSVHGVAFQSGPALDYRVSRTVTVGGELLYDLFIDPANGHTTHAVLLGFSASFAL